MMKKISLFSSLLAAGMLFGTGMSAMTSHVQVRAATEATASNQSGQSQKAKSNKRSAVPKSSFKLSVTAENAEFDENTGTLTGFSQEWVDEHPEQIKNLLNGGQLVIPDEINGVPVETIGEREVQTEIEPDEDEIETETGAFSRHLLITMLGEDPYNQNNSNPGISSIIGGTNLTSIAEDGFWGNILETLTLINLEKVGDCAFSNTSLAQINLPKVTEIGESAFANNQLTQINLPKVTEIGETAFTHNQLTQIDLPKVSEIRESAFVNNQLAQIKLPTVTNIGEYAFGQNHLSHIELPENINLGEIVFSDQKISQNVTATKDGEVPFEIIKPQLKIGEVDQIERITNIDILSPTDTITTENNKIVGISGKDPIKLNILFDFEMIPENQGDYSIHSSQLTINPFDDNNGGDGENNGNGGDNNNGNNGSGGGNSGGSIGTETQPDNNTNGSDNNEVKPLPNPNKPAAAPHSVYALRGMRLHKNVSLTDPVKSYKKQARTKAANFRIQGVAYDQNGKKRYKVKGGYITASSKYVADSHFRSKKISRVRVISNKANSYKDLKLSKNQKVRSYKKGTKLNVKRIVNYGRTTRFELTNGRYISGNKQIFIMDQK